MDRNALLAPAKPYATLATSIGTLGVYFLSAAASDKVQKQTGERFGKQPDDEFACTLFPLICWPVTSEEQPKPSATTLTPQDVARLTPEEQDAIATIFLAHNKSYTHKTISVSEKKPDGSPITRLTTGAIEYPPQDSERPISYLQRILALRTKELQEHLRKNFADTQKMINSLHTGFSISINDQITKTLSQGAQLQAIAESLTKKWENIRFAIPEPAHATATLPELPPLPLVSLPELFDGLQQQIKQVVLLASTGNEFLVGMNNTQTAIAAAIKESADSSRRWTIAGFIVAALVLGITTFSLWWSWHAAATTARTNKTYLDEVLKSLHSIDQKTTPPPAPVPATAPARPSTTPKK